MSQENVELVRSVHPPSGTRLSDLFDDEGRARALIDSLAPIVTPDLEVRGGDLHGGGVWAEGSGLEGLFEVWRDWLAPWDEYWTEVEDFIDAGEDRVLVLVHDRGRLRGVQAEVDLVTGSVWTVRGGRIARIEFHTNRKSAFEAAGLSN
jgi:SnoaL-like protein